MDKIDVLLNLPLQLHFPLKKYGYSLERVLNNKNRWHTKIVCSILYGDSRRYVSTTYEKQNDYLRLVETTVFLNCNNKSSPRIVGLYPKDQTIVCDYIGEFLSDYLLNNPFDISLSLSSIFNYLKDINSINQSYKKFITPSILKASLQLTEEFSEDFEFLPKFKAILPELERSDIKFIYGYGIEDPHIWNFRIAENKDEIQALTTDFDYFSDRVNCFWELGYFYATFRWMRKNSFLLASEAEELLLSLIQNQDLKSEFMFWLGVLSSYCGYKDSLRNLMRGYEIDSLKEQYEKIHQLDERVSFLASRLLREESFRYQKVSIGNNKRKVI